MILVIISLIISFTLGLIIGEYINNRSNKNKENKENKELNKTYDELLREIIGNAMYNTYQDDLEKVKYRKQYSSFKYYVRNYININDYIKKCLNKN